MINANLLKGAIKSNGLTQSEVAKSIGISRASMNYKINNKRQFTASEITKLSHLLNIDNKEAYFFADVVAKPDTN